MKKPKHKWAVYYHRIGENYSKKELVGETSAVSEAQAINNVRFREGLREYTDDYFTNYMTAELIEETSATSYTDKKQDGEEMKKEKVNINHKMVDIDIEKVKELAESVPLGREFGRTRSCFERVFEREGKRCQAQTVKAFAEWLGCSTEEIIKKDDRQSLQIIDSVSEEKTDETPTETKPIPDNDEYELNETEKKIIRQYAVWNEKTDEWVMNQMVKEVLDDEERMRLVKLYIRVFCYDCVFHIEDLGDLDDKEKAK